MKQLSILVSSLALLASVAEAAGPVHSPNLGGKRLELIAPVAQGTLELRPTFNACGVVFGSADRGAVTLEVAPKGTDAWKSVELPPYFAESKEYKASIFGLRENTEYDVRLRAGDTVLTKGSFRTWASEVPIARTVVIDPAKATFPIRITDHGSPSGWIRYTVKPGKVLVNETKEPAFALDGAAYVVLDDIVMKGSQGRHAITLRNTGNVRIRNCEVTAWGLKGEMLYEGLGRPFEFGSRKDLKIVKNIRGGYETRGGKRINFDGAISVGEGCTETVIERCYVHDANGRSNSWYYSHPAGNEAVTMEKPEHSTVIRWCDFVGDDAHRFNDAVESLGNFMENGGFNREADIYGNFMAFCNDDCIELDGGQRNVRCYGNRFESALCGVSIQGCMVSPSYVYRNLFSGMGDEFGAAGQTVKTGGGSHGEEARAYIRGNTFWGPGCGIIMMDLLRATVEGNTFCGKQNIQRREQAGNSHIGENVFDATIPEDQLDTRYPQRPVGFLLDRARFSGITVKKGVISQKTVEVTATAHSDTPFVIRQNETLDWFTVTPAKGLMKAGEKTTFTVTFDPAKMTNRHDYRGAFLVRTPNGLSRPVTLYVETDFVPPYKAERPGMFAEYKRLEEMTKGADGTYEATFTAPKAGIYWILQRGHKTGKRKALLSAALDDEKMADYNPQMKAYDTWTMLTPGHRFGNMLRPYKLAAGPHRLRFTLPKKAGCTVEALVLTDDPGAFEPR